MPTSVLLSIKPRFAQAILEGTKKYEFRRAVFRSESVNRVVIYASSPVRKVIGEFVLDGILKMRPRDLWAHTRKGSGIEREHFDDYFKGVEYAHALRIGRLSKYRTPKELKRDFGVHTPPQSFCYLE